MSPQPPLIGPGAHELLNSVKAVEGLVARASWLLESSEDTAAAEALALLEAAEKKAAAVAERLRRLALGTPVVIDLDERAPTDTTVAPAHDTDAS